MPRIEDLFKRFLPLSEEEQRLFVRSYRFKRMEDLSKAEEKKDKKKGSKISKEQRDVMKKLGISLKDLKKMLEE